MKVGDLVKWTCPGAEDIGMIINMNHPWGSDTDAIIHWFGTPEFSGLYPLDHEYMEVYDAAG
jgi:hypothetical protein